MKSCNEYIEIIKSFSDVLRTQFGVKSLRLFGSVARGEQTSDSDLDICVVMNPNMLLHIRLKNYLEKILGCNVDVVREHKNMNETLKKEIERDGIEVFKERAGN
jgi:predicted nucleotidyltransferase